jgi:hypothetical protein
MNDDTKPNRDRLHHERVHEEMLDSFDEELELEIDDDRLEKLLADMSEHPERATLDRRIYFKELFRLQGELVKLQDWVLSQKLKVVVIFEGRDSPARAASSSASPSASIRASAGWPRCRPPTSASARSGIFSATRPICRPAARSCCSIAAGTTAPASSA